jgi:rRNA-processing protein FCF1
MILVVNDANVLIDMIELNLLSEFFGLTLEFHTTSFILFELHEHQLQKLKPFVENNAMKIQDFNFNEVEILHTLQQEKPQLSTQDCSALYCAQKLNATLLTSDRNLRQFAKAKTLPVHGHLWVLDLMVAQQKLDGIKAINLLDKLKDEINPKLGLSDKLCIPFIKRWKTLA